MKIQYASDLHLEFGMGIDLRMDRDVLVLAGDIDTGTDAKEFILREAEVSPVIYVAGNHEFYGYDIDEVRQAWAEIAADHPNLHFLDDASVNLGGVLFVGGTLWTDMSRNDPLVKLTVQQGMNDYYLVSEGDKEFSPDSAYARHQKTKQFIAQSIREAGDSPVVVVTHMAPHLNSLSRDYYPQLNPAYASDMDEFIHLYAPDVWIHGHIHAPQDYWVGATRVLANPRGYVGRRRENAGFNRTLSVRV